MSDKYPTRVIPQYLDLLGHQRETAFQALEGLSENQIWQRPEPGEWSIGEILNHTQLLFSSIFPLVRLTWGGLKWAGKLWRGRDYHTEIEDTYQKETFPMWVGFLWKPKVGTEKPLPLAVLKDELREEHAQVRIFYEDKPEDLLGNLFLFDPLFGFINLIVTLQIGIYHDQLHYEDVVAMANRLKGTA